MATSGVRLPQLDADVFLTDGGLETSLIFDDGIDLPEFAAFPLLAHAEGRAALERYFERYLSIAQRDGVGIILETPTWRASSDWAEVLGVSTDDLAALNRTAVDQLRSLQASHDVPIVLSGCVGPRGDGYRPGEMMSRAQALAYHLPQVKTLADAGVDLITAITMTSSEEAIGVALAARAAEAPVVISFTVEVDGALPSGEGLGEAIEAVDQATDGYAAYFMVNCAHPTHFAGVLDASAPWAQRLRGVRANASKMSHAELDEAPELDPGDPDELAADYVELRRRLPHLTVLGGCCGTNEAHIDAISRAVASAGEH